MILLINITTMLIAIYFSFSVLRSSVGRAFMAVREDPISAAASGINVKKHKMLAFVLRYAHLPPGYIHPNNYTVIEMVTFLAMVVFGGLGHIWGGIWWFGSYLGRNNWSDYYYDCL